MPESQMFGVWIGWLEPGLPKMGASLVGCECGKWTWVETGAIRRCRGRCGRWFGRVNARCVWAVWEREAQ